MSITIRDGFKLKAHQRQMLAHKSYDTFSESAGSTAVGIEVVVLLVLVLLLAPPKARGPSWLFYPRKHAYG